jgi:hypothetical protein
MVAYGYGDYRQVPIVRFSLQRRPCLIRANCPGVHAAIPDPVGADDAPQSPTRQHDRDCR